MDKQDAYHRLGLSIFCPTSRVRLIKIKDLRCSMLAEKGKKVTIGGTEAIEKNRDMFKTILTTYVE